MKLVATAKIKLKTSSIEELLATISLYTKAFNFVCQIGFNNKDKNGVSLHHKTYQKTREYLPSQLAISARTKATEALKGLKSKKYQNCPKSEFCSIRYDVNSFTLFLKSNQVSLLTVSGRKRFDLIISDYHKKYFESWKHKSADLIFSKDKKKVYLHITFEKEVNDVPSSNRFIGIDRGIKNIAVTSNNQFFGGGKVKQKVFQYQNLRSKLQKKGTKSAKRHLRRLRGKERRFRADVNHVVTKQIIASLNPGDTIVLENLKGIRNQRLRKEQRRLINNWSFFQFEQFLKYKAFAKGISVVYIDARYTSQCCSRCGFTAKNNRKDQAHFMCRQCGFKLHADLNASRNICNKHLTSQWLADGAAINQPIVSVLIGPNTSVLF